VNGQESSGPLCPDYICALYVKQHLHFEEDLYR